MIKTYSLKFIERFNLLVFLGAALFFLLSHLGRWSRYFELMSHFRMQFFVVFVFNMIVFLIIAKKHWKIASVIFTLWASINIIPWYFSSSSVTLSDEAKQLNIYYANVLTQNKKHEQVVKQIEDSDPDVIVLIETDQDWVESIEVFEKEYPYTKKIPRYDNFGMLVMSKYPSEKIETLYFTKDRIPSIYMSLNVDGKVVHMLATHPLPPMSDYNLSSRNVQMKKIAEFVSSFKGSCILVGDFNASMWSPYYIDMINETGFINCRKGFGINPSWPNFSKILTIPIDHCIVSPDIMTTHFEVLSDVGSDHYPMIVKLKF